MQLRSGLAGLLALLTVTISAGSSLAGTGKKKSPSSKPRASARSSRPALAMSAPLRRPRIEETAAARPRKARAAKAAQPSGRRRKVEVDRWPPMRLEAVNTGEKASLRLYDRRGRTLKPAVRSLSRLLRCHLTGQQIQINWRLIRNLYTISRHYAGKTIYIYSGYRARRVASLRSSNHVKGRAVDLRVAGVSSPALRDYLMHNFKPCGVGYYPNVPFVHFDVRDKQSAFWVDYSGKGESAEYAANPYAVLKSEKKGVGRAGAASTASPAAGADEPAPTQGKGPSVEAVEPPEAPARAAAAQKSPVPPAPPLRPAGKVIQVKPAEQESPGAIGIPPAEAASSALEPQSPPSRAVPP